MNYSAYIGNLTKDPVLEKRGENKTSFTRITVAVKRPGRDAGADFIPIQVWGAQAENVCKYLSKGRQVAVEAHTQTGSYTDKEGKTVYTIDIVANRVEFLGSGGGSAGKSGTASEGSAGNAAPAPQAVESDFDTMEDDIPF
jgi:single-strand DNA-binding protein